jgi:RHS repeat-associated protein
LIYDALGRLVEEDTGSTYVEIWQTQVGRVAFMEGSVEKYSLWPTPSGSASQTDSGYLHKDWLGSARLGSSISASTVTFDQAYAPYGDIYANYGGGGFSCCGGNETTFAMNTQDVTTGIYNTPNRELGSQGRWFSPDPAQSGWNPYAYATNPNSMIDPTGLSDCGGREACGDPGGPGDPSGPGDPAPGYDILGSDDLYFDFWNGNETGCGMNVLNCSDLGPYGLGRQGPPNGFNFGFGFSGPGLCSDVIPCGFAPPTLGQTIWSDVLGLPANLPCPQGGGISGLLCGGVSPIMDASTADCMDAADQQANAIMNDAIARGNKAMSQVLPSSDWAGVFVTGWGIRSLGKIGKVTPLAILEAAALGALAKATWFTGKAATIEFSGGLQAIWVSGHSNCGSGWGGLQQ